MKTDLEVELEALHIHLDNQPDDWQTRRVLSDLYEETGDVTRAEFQRWLADHEKCPAPPADYKSTPEVWDWYQSQPQDSRPEVPDTSRLGRLVFRGRVYNRHPSRQIAEECLMKEIHYLGGYQEAKRIMNS